MYAVVSPRDHEAGLLCDQNARVRVLDRAGVPTRSQSTEQYFSRHPDTLMVEVRDGIHAVEVLRERATMSMCLDMILLLFDRDVSVHTRQELAMELDLLFQNEENRKYVLDIILCAPLSPSADTDGALNAVESASVTREIVRSILRCQERVRLVLQSWLLVKQGPIVQQAGVERVFALLSRHGTFRRLALEATDTAQLDLIKPSLATDPDLQKQLDASPRIVLALAKELKKKLPAGQIDQYPVRAVANTDAGPSSDSYECGLTATKHKSAHAAYEAALSQVERIAGLYAELKDRQAEAMLDELVAEQTKHSAGEQYVVKSLCNVANRAGAHGRPEISLKCLMKALEFPNGIDSILYLQIGTGLREMRQFDSAVKCYECAKRLDDGSLSDRIRLEMIRTTVAKGNYQQALAEYLAIPDLQDKPTESCGLGTLYRKMGLPHESRVAYRSSLRIDGSMHTAYAGLAEVWKQVGKPHRAIVEYNVLIEHFKGLDARSRKVYDLARSHLFRSTGQYHKSEAILRELVTAFPADRDVHLQFANMLALRGDFDRAQDHFEKARGPSLRELAQLIFVKATGRFDSALIRKGLENVQNSLMPEEKGVASCIEAYDLITNSDFQRARDVLRDVTFVGRLNGDFAKVLGFHAMRRITGNFNYKCDQALCRVAKRSDRGLRCAIRLIAADDFRAAEQFESEFLLRVLA